MLDCLVGIIGLIFSFVALIIIGSYIKNHKKDDELELDRLANEKKRLEAIEKERVQRIEREKEEREWRIENQVSENIFSEIVKVVKTNYVQTRLFNFYNNGSIVHGTVSSHSGISEWDFELNFNDHGFITGVCCINSENFDSPIPKTIMKMIQKYIHYYKKFDGGDEEFLRRISQIPYRDLEF